MSWYEDETVTLLHGDCLEVMRSLPDDSVDAIVTDPPYGLGFMGKAWDDLPPGLPWAQECIRVLKPGGHLLAFGGSRTWHRLAVAVEDAGFEVRDSIAWLYGSGFPKSRDVAKAIDLALTPRDEPDLTLDYRVTAWMRGTGITAAQINAATASNMGGHYLTAASQPAVPTAAMLDTLRPLLPPVPEWVEQIVAQREREKAEARARAEAARFLDTMDVKRQHLPATPTAEQWQGWGTALKPAFEPIVVARKPLTGTVAGNVLTWGTGALNIDGCRVGMSDADREVVDKRSGSGNAADGWGAVGNRPTGERYTSAPAGRWPANVVLDGTQADALDQQSGIMRDGVAVQRNGGGQKIGATVYSGSGGGTARPDAGYGGSGGASRFFPTFRYQAKAPTSERPKVDGVAHPTVKPLELMRWLVRLVTPPGGTVLEPFAGSGTTVEAAMLEGFRVIGIEREADYLPLILARIERVGLTPPVAEPPTPELAEVAEPTLLDLLAEGVA